MRKSILSLLSSILVVSSIYAQDISGVVKDQQGKGLDKSTVSLLHAKDSSLIKLAVTSDNGTFHLDMSGTGKYLISVSHVGYVTQYSKVFELSGAGKVNLSEIQLVKMPTEMKEVVVTNKKPVVEVKADKMILNVEGTINATGSNALDLLRKSPGVMVDKDDNITLAGKNGLQIYIDGRPTPLSGTDLSNFLKSIQSSEIESIEIITNPSAKYEAAGNAGIINIKLKKNKTFGTNGSMNLGYGIGIYPKYNGGLSLNYRNKKVNLFGSYNYSHNLSENKMFLYRTQLDTLFDQRGTMTNTNISHGFKAGLDYFVNKKSTMGVMVTGNLSDMSLRNYSRTPIIYIPTNVTDRILVADNTSKMKRNNADFNFNYHYADPGGHTLDVDADYGLYRLNSNQLQPNFYYDPTGTTELNQYIYNFISPTNIDIYSVKTDYEQNYKKGRLGFGGKVSVVNTDNNFGRYDVDNNIKTLDVGRSNQFNYSENINALYVNYNRPVKGAVIQAGLRVENTNSDGKSYPLNADGSVNYSTVQNFKRHYTDLFPSAAITFNKKPTNQWTISYSRRIDRPAYQDLNPFEFKLDEYTYQKGNTNLQPQYTNSIGLTNVYKFKLTTALNFSHVADVFTQLIDTAERSKAFISKKNLATQNIVSLNVSYPIMYKAYSAFINVNSYYSHYKADFGGGNRVVNLDVVAMTLYMQNSIKIGKKGWTGELSGFYSTPTIWQGTFKSKQLWSVDGGFQKSLFKNKGTLKVSVSDIFKTLNPKGSSDFAGQHISFRGQFESRQFKVAYIWRFGNSQVKAARQRKSSAEEEMKRSEQSGGGIGNQ
jgi:iron complex outermembrane receptor protein